MTAIDLGRPVSGDVVELILDDHRRFEALLRDLRDSTSDRDAVRQAFATLHVAHAEAEEKFVYPKLRRKDAITEHEAEHGEEEHAEGHEALLAVLELKGTDTQAFDDAVEELAKAVNHHLTEEELTILNPAREEVGERVRADLGEQFADRAQPADRRQLRVDHERTPHRRRGPSRGAARRRGRRGGVAATRSRCRAGAACAAAAGAPRSCFRTMRRLLDSMMSFFCTVVPISGMAVAIVGNTGHGKPPNMVIAQITQQIDGRDQERHEGVAAATSPTWRRPAPRACGCRARRT